MIKKEYEELELIAKDYPVVKKLLEEHRQTTEASVDRFNVSVKKIIDSLSEEIEILSGTTIISNTEDRLFERIMTVIDKAAKVKEALGEHKPDKKTKPGKESDEKVHI